MHAYTLTQINIQLEEFYKQHNHHANWNDPDKTIPYKGMGMFLTSTCHSLTAWLEITLLLPKLLKMKTINYKKKIFFEYLNY
jgi:hypothetical protein